MTNHTKRVWRPRVELRLRGDRPFRRTRVRPLLEQFEDRTLLSTFSVTNTADNGNNTNPILGSLRAAIIAANADTDPNGSVINFDIPWADPGHVYYVDDGTAGTVSRGDVAPIPTTATDGTTPITSDAQLADPSLVGAGHTIDPDWAHSWYTFPVTAALPDLTNQVTVNGYSQPGSSPNDLAQGDDAVIKVEIDGSGINGPRGTGLSLAHPGSSVYGLAVNGFSFGPSSPLVGIGLGADSAATGCFVGTDVSGTVALGNDIGIDMSPGSVAGGAAPAARDVISGNRVFGVGSSSEYMTGLQVLGDFIGTDASGTRAIGNTVGVHVIAGTSATVGGTAPGSGNVISGNVDGIDDFAGTATIQGNLIGTNASGTAALGNSSIGISYYANNGGTIGGTAPGAGNVISAGANAFGVFLSGDGGVVVQGNDFGTDKTGTHDLQPGFAGADIAVGSDDNLIGGTTPAARNIISGSGAGVRIAAPGGVTSVSGNVVEGNYIGTDVSGEYLLGNFAFRSGISLGSGAIDNVIGGTTPGAGNLISASNGFGVWISRNGAGGLLPSGNIVEGNVIGLDATGTRALGNNAIGIVAEEGANTIGGSAPGAGNVISGNIQFGVAVGDPTGGGDPTGEDSLATETVVEGNRIGTDATGTKAVPNGVGVWLNHFTTGVTIGGTAPGAGNLISGNSSWGIQFTWNSDNDTVQGNLVGTDVTGTQPLGNGGGVDLELGSTDNLVGGTAVGAGNVIANSTTSAGVLVGELAGDPGTGNTIQGNSIFANASLGIDLGGDGVTLNDSHAGQPGPNGWQNFPVIASAYAGTLSITIGTFHSTPSTTFALDFYANAAADPSGYGQGQRWLGTTTVTTDSSGNASFTAQGLSASVAGEWISATATGPSGTSEFSLDAQAAPLPPSSLSGVVFADFNNDGQVDFGEHGIPGVPITVTGTDFLGNPVNLSQTTDSAGTYVFLNLRPGTYTITETQQPTGYTPGIVTAGTGGGSVSGFQITVSLPAGVDAMNNNYGEQPVATGGVRNDQTASIGFWNNKRGQALIKALNGGVGSTQLGNWLAATFPHIFGSGAGSDDLAGDNNAAVADFFQKEFVIHGVKLDAQVLATALSVYVTNAALDNTGVGSQYDFIVSGNGVGTATFNVGNNGAAFGVANCTKVTVMDLLFAVDSQAVNGVLYNGDKAKREAANDVFSELNEGGDD